jgi:tRNA wybutosine-synthesizing protein 4
LGYVVDPYVQFFYKKTEKKRLPPIINRGYFARVHLLKQNIRAFCNLYAPNHQQNAKIKVQIVALGAGYDTSFWNLMDELKESHEIYFVETDFHDVVIQKSKVISSQPKLNEILHNATFDTG